jgi:PKD repeat protein
VADFTAGPTSGAGPLTVFFTNLSSGANNYLWDFGDGNSSAIINPANTYASPGAYTVKLTAIGAQGSNTFTRTNYIAIATTNVFCTGLPSGLVAWWRGESNTLDAIGSNNAILVNGATYAPGKVGTAFSFDGSGAYLELTNSAAFNFDPTTPMSMELCAYRTSAGLMHVFGKTRWLC